MVAVIYVVVVGSIFGIPIALSMSVVQYPGAGRADLVRQPLRYCPPPTPSASVGVHDGLVPVGHIMASVSEASGAPPYKIEFRWKEEVIYWEGDRGFVFDGGWGASPPVTYVPTPELWDEVVPPWLKGRRDEVVARLRAHPGHVLEETSRYQGGWQELGAGE